MKSKKKPGIFVVVLRVSMQCLWLFFPGIFLVLLAFYTMTFIGQGRDIVTTIVEAESVGFYPILAISFWGCLTWYSSRHVAIKKKYTTYELTYFLIQALEHVPRFLALACFLIVEIAILHSPVIQIDVWFATLFSLLVNLTLIFVGKLLFRAKGFVFRKKPYLSYGFTLVVLMLLSMLLNYFELKVRLYSMFVLVLFAGMALLAFANSRRRDVNRQFFLADSHDAKEKPHFIPVMIFVLLLGLAFYLLTIFSIGFSQIIKPFNYYMLSFGVIIASTNFVTWLSVKHNLNFHFILLLGVIVAGFFTDQYQIRTLPATTSFNNRISMDEYFDRWYNKHEAIINDSSVTEVPIFVTLADGGASRSAYWVAQVLGEIQDQMGDMFFDRLFIISGASGGGVGNVTFYDILYQQKHYRKTMPCRPTAKIFLEKDLLTFPTSRMLNPLYFLNDRASALEKAMDHSFPSLSNPFSKYILTENDTVMMPILYINTTRMQDSYPCLISNIQYDEHQLNNRLDFLDKLDERGLDIRLSTAAVLSSRFPYMSPAGGLDKEYFVDGGYFDNSGAGAVHETLLAFEKFLESKSPKNWQKVTFNVLHIRNSKGDDHNFKRVNPFVNDLFAPILVLAASYGQQTEINTQRLKYYIYNRDNAKPEQNWYTVSLYGDQEGEREYSMNWYMSQECRQRIDQRFEKVLKDGDLGDFIGTFESFAVE